MSFALPLLYPILDSHCFPQEAGARATFLARVVGPLAEAGVTLLQLRMKGATRAEVLAAAHTVRKAAPASMRLILNDHPDLVHEAGFDGVHLGQDDVAVDEARELLGRDALIGYSTHNPEQLRAGNTTSADYLAVGPVFATTSKADAEPVIGLNGVRAARALTDKPLVAIGGITLVDGGSVREAGADSIAVIGALFKNVAGDPSSAGRLAGDFLKLFR